MEGHNDRLEQVLTRIEDAVPKLSPEKFRFLQTEIHQLRHVINQQVVRTDQDKIESVKASKRSKKV